MTGYAYPISKEMQELVELFGVRADNRFLKPFDGTSIITGLSAQRLKLRADSIIEVVIANVDQKIGVEVLELEVRVMDEKHTCYLLRTVRFPEPIFCYHEFATFMDSLNSNSSVYYLCEHLGAAMLAIVTLTMDLKGA